MSFIKESTVPPATMDHWELERATHLTDEKQEIQMVYSQKQILVGYWSERQKNEVKIVRRKYEIGLHVITCHHPKI